MKLLHRIWRERYERIDPQADRRLIRVGNIIRHDRFGQGEVIDISGDGDNAKIGVEFENVGKKQLLLKFAKFTVVE